MTEEDKKAIETMQHWIEYEKANKDKINKAEELITIQETILNLIQKLQEENKILKNKEKFYNKLAEDNEYYADAIKKKGKIIDSAIKQVEQLRQDFSEDLQVDFIIILEILKDKKVIDW